MIDPDRRIAADWLALRRAADAEARRPAKGFVDRLARLAPASAVDVGAGTGANHDYLAQRLPDALWVLLDHDTDLLATSDTFVTRVVGGVESLASIVAVARPPILVTCSALLDLLTTDELDLLAEALARPGVVGLFALTVDGTFVADPPHPADEALSAAFNAHQRRAGRPGPDAAAHLARACRERGLAVQSVATPWALGASHRPLLDRLLRERAAAASEQHPGQAAAFARWLTARERQLAAGTLRVRVGHTDLLVLPSGEGSQDELGAGRPVD